MARRFSRPVRRSAKRKTVWIGTASAANVAVANAVSAVHSSFAPDDLAMLAPTVVRVRGTVNIFPAADADLTYFGAYGLCIVSDEALAAGAASIPRPHDDDDWGGWIVHGYYGGRIDFQSSIGVVPNMSVETHIIDGKAMRKVEVNESLVWMVEAEAGGINIILQARVLMMLS